MTTGSIMIGEPIIWTLTATLLISMKNLPTNNANFPKPIFLVEFKFLHGIKFL